MVLGFHVWDELLPGFFRCSSVVSWSTHGLILFLSCLVDHCPSIPEEQCSENPFIRLYGFWVMSSVRIWLIVPYLGWTYVEVPFPLLFLIVYCSLSRELFFVNDDRGYSWMQDGEITADSTTYFLTLIYFDSSLQFWDMEIARSKNAVSNEINQLWFKSAVA